MKCSVVLNLAAAAAKSLQSYPTLCDHMDGSPPGSAVPGILQAGTLEWVAISFSNAWKWKVKVKLLSHVRLFETPWTAAYQAPPWDFPGKSTGVGCHCLLHDKLSLCIKKQRHHFADKVSLVKAMVFPIVMYGCESWTIKKTEHWRTDAFEDSWEFLGLQGDPTSPS